MIAGASNWWTRSTRISPCSLSVWVRGLIVVCGGGGARDRQKRPLMAEAVDRHADYAIITSDNPRKEDPDAIIAEIEKGFRSNHHEKITERAQAIARAVEIAQPRDIV